MILTCPACRTQYVVKDGAIPPGGRQVRCASCRHSWHQDPESDEDEASATAAGTNSEEGEATGLASGEPAVDHLGDDAETEALPRPEDAEERFAEPPVPAPIPEPGDADGMLESGDTAVEETEPAYPAVEPQPTPAIADDSVDDDFSPFAQRNPVERQRRSPLLAALLVALLIAALAAAFWFLAPVEWKQGLGMAAAGETPLQLMMTHSDRQRLASGNELLAISGRVINPTDKSQDVPPITAQLRNSAGKLVYSWTIAPPAPTLQPGASASFNSAEVNVPAGGDELTVTLGTPKAG